LAEETGQNQALNSSEKSNQKSSVKSIPLEKSKIIKDKQLEDDLFICPICGDYQGRFESVRAHALRKHHTRLVLEDGEIKVLEKSEKKTTSPSPPSKEEPIEEERT